MYIFNQFLFTSVYATLYFYLSFTLDNFNYSDLYYKIK